MCSFSKILSADQDEIRSLIIDAERSVLTDLLKQLTPDEVRRIGERERGDESVRSSFPLSPGVRKVLH